MRKSWFLGAFVLCGLLSNNAHAADELGEPGQVALGVERLFGINHWSSTAKPSEKPEVTLSGTSIGLVVNGGTTATFDEATFPMPYSIPRLALDYMVADGVSIGGSIGYTRRTGEVEAGGQTSDVPTVTALVLAPRVGYVFPLTDGVDFWLRAGVTYFRAAYEYDVQNTPSDDSLTGFALSADGALVLSPIAGFGFYLGPTVDVGLSGTYTDEGGGGSEDVDATLSSFGLNAGLVGWF
ncbi:MAG: outer membrane beta-barrel protein [Polyangiaceae bacterium]|nr:outer membrane beta-barrel protein [Polyangiaceae bacterium]